MMITGSTIQYNIPFDLPFAVRVLSFEIILGFPLFRVSELIMVFMAAIFSFHSGTKIKQRQNSCRQCETQQWSNLLM